MNPPTGSATFAYKERILSLYEVHREMIFAFVRRRVRPEDVEDVLQEILKGFVEGFVAFCGKSSEKTWVYSVCRFTVFKYYARNRRGGEIRALKGELPTLVDVTSPLELLIADEVSSIQRQVLADLRPMDREILELRFVEELPFAEIAVILGLPSDEACRSRCRRAIQTASRRLREITSSSSSTE